MATAKKIILSSSRDIPFNQLVISQANVRRVKAGVSIEELAQDIARRTLLQSISVRPVRDADGNETGMFEIPAGGRRYRALELLVKQKRLAKNAPVPCVVREDGIAEEDSLAENVQRTPLHPLDQFRAFQDMRVKGMTEEEIAAAFFVQVTVVKQRLRLASVSPALLDIYAEDGMTLEQLMAFTVSADHTRQEQVWDAIKDAWSKEPYQIRRMLTETTVRASDKRAVLVGIDVYEAAGGIVMRDLFQSDDGGWLQDPALLDRLVAEKLKASAKAVAAEGWKWIEVAVSFPYDATRGLREIQREPLGLSADEQATIDALNGEYKKLEADYEGADELPDDVDQRLGEIETALAVFEKRPVRFDPVDVPRAGVFISVDADGLLSIDRGYVRPEDEPSVSIDDEDNSPIDNLSGDPSAPAVQGPVITIGGQPEQPDEDEDDVIKPLPDRLVSELTAERTLALRDKLANNPEVAFLAVLHKFCLDVFSRYTTHGVAMELAIRGTVLSAQAPGLKDAIYARAIAERHKAWEERLPKDQASLWDWLFALGSNEQAALFAHCASFGVNALYEKADRYGGGASSAHGVQRRIAEADRLARATGLDLVEAGWKPTVDNYLGRVTKIRILQAVREGAGDQAAQLIDHLKKVDMAKEAERLLADSGWLPEPLRLIDGAPTAVEAGGEDDSHALPEFLSGAADDEARDDEDDERNLIAAE